MSADPDHGGFVGKCIAFAESEWELEKTILQAFSINVPRGSRECHQGAPELTCDVIRGSQCATQQRGNNAYSVQFDDGGVFTFIFSIFFFLLFFFNPSSSIAPDSCFQ